MKPDRIIWAIVVGGALAACYVLASVKPSNGATCSASIERRLCSVYVSARKARRHKWTKRRNVRRHRSRIERPAFVPMPIPRPASVVAPPARDCQDIAGDVFPCPSPLRIRDGFDDIRFMPLRLMLPAAPPAVVAVKAPDHPKRPITGLIIVLGLSAIAAALVAVFPVKMPRGRKDNA